MKTKLLYTDLIFDAVQYEHTDPDAANCLHDVFVSNFFRYVFAKNWQPDKKY